MRPLDPTKQANILKAVFTIAGRNGLAGINIALVAKEAGIGVGSLYTYFSSKEELIQAAFANVEHQISHKMYEKFDINQPIKESFKRIYLNTLNYRLKHYNETVLIDQYIQSNYVQLNFNKQVKDFEEHNKPLYNLIKKGQQEGLLIDMAPFTMISFINGAIRSCSNGIVQKLIPLNKQMFEDCFSMTWKGIKR